MNLVQQIQAARYTAPSYNEMTLADTILQYKDAFGKKSLSVRQMADKRDKSYSNTYKHFAIMGERGYIVKAGMIPGTKTALWKWNFERKEQ